MTTVAIQGEKGSYSEEAAIKMCGEDAEIVGFSDFIGTIDAAMSERVDLVVIPVENQIVGELEIPNKLIRSSGLAVKDHAVLAIRHVLAGTRDAEVRTIVSVRSQLEALKQCTRFFTTNPGITQLIDVDTAGSLRRVVSENQQHNAAICSARAAEIYDAKILAENIADQPDNWTKFVLLSR